MELQELADFIRKWNITAQMGMVSTNFNVAEGETPTRKGSFKLIIDGAKYEGLASWDTKTRTPMALELLNDLRSVFLVTDAHPYFFGWAKDMGLDSDSRKAEEMFKNRVKESEEFEKWLGTGRFHELLWQTKGL